MVVTARLHVVTVISILAFSSVRAAKILGVFPSCGYSQFIFGDALMSSLANRGHDVTVISPFPPKIAAENYKHVSTAEVIEFCKGFDFYDTELDTAINNIKLSSGFGYYLANHTLQNKNVKALLSSNATFDLVISEQVFDEAFYGLAHHYKSSLIIVSTAGPSEWTNHVTITPLPLSYVPSIFSDFTYDMNLHQRVKNIFIKSVYAIYQHFVMLPQQNQLLQQHFPDAPNVVEMIGEVDLVLVNSHFSTHYPVPSVPNSIEIAGSHINLQPLPKHLQKYLDEAQEGAIFFSMGSNVKSSALPKDKLQHFLRSFANIKQKILWKWEDDNLEGKPSNVMIEKWLPQVDVLAHPNVKAFISHCGLFSTIESVYNGVPVICIPIFFDQKMNSAMLKSHGMSITINFYDFTEKTFTSALKEIINNPVYTEKAKYKSRLFHDQPMKPIDRAMYWIEYVIRHKNTKHLRVHGFNLKWYQYYLIDVALLIISTLILCWLIVHFMIKIMFKK